VGQIFVLLELVSRLILQKLYLDFYQVLSTFPLQLPYLTARTDGAWPVLARIREN
jgi:hypothetical protein